MRRKKIVAGLAGFLALAVSLIAHNVINVQAGPLPPEEMRWVISFYDNIKLANAPVFETTVEPSTDPVRPINLMLDWYNSSPAAAVPNDNFSAMLRRNLVVAETGSYRHQAKYRELI